MFFPTVKGSNLVEREFVLPYSLEGEYNVVMLAFEPSHQYALRSWMPTLEFLAEEYPDFRFYQVAILADLPPMQRMFNDNVLRRAVQDELTRSILITVYCDKSAFCEALGLPNEDTIYVMLLDHEGELLWRTEGSASKKVCGTLIEQVRMIFSLDNEMDFPQLGS
jgi:hypothetical protein